jgi:hypothetical protein
VYLHGQFDEEQRVTAEALTVTDANEDATISASNGRRSFFKADSFR